jgi:hypothetical protein
MQHNPWEKGDVFWGTCEHAVQDERRLGERFPGSDDDVGSFYIFPCRLALS